MDSKKTIAYHGSASLFDHFDPAHILEGDGKYKFGVGAYLTSRYETAALYAGKTGSRDKYVYTVEIPDMTDDNHLVSRLPVHPAIVRKAEERLGMSIPAEACASGKFFRKWIGNTLIGFGKTETVNGVYQPWVTQNKMYRGTPAFGYHGKFVPYDRDHYISESLPCRGIKLSIWIFFQI